jgi:hypothetical protein
MQYVINGGHSVEAMDARPLLFETVVMCVSPK